MVEVGGMVVDVQGGGDDAPPPWEWTSDYNDDSTVSAPPPFNESMGPSLEAKSCVDPLEFFGLLFPDELVQLITDNTILYANNVVCPFLCHVMMYLHTLVSI